MEKTTEKQLKKMRDLITCAEIFSHLNAEMVQNPCKFSR